MVRPSTRLPPRSHRREADCACFPSLSRLSTHPNVHAPVTPARGRGGTDGLSLPTILRAETAGGSKKATAKSVIMLFQFGGPSHLDTFDPKPDAPSGIRGEFGTLKTKTPGLLVTEHLPKLAERSDLYTVIRSVRHTRRRTTPERTTRSPAENRSSTSSPRTHRPPTSPIPVRSLTISIAARRRSRPSSRYRR